MRKNIDMLKLSEGLIKSVIKKSIERDINNSTCITLYQPKVPVAINSFVKKTPKND